MNNKYRGHKGNNPMIFYIEFIIINMVLEHPLFGHKKEFYFNSKQFRIFLNFGRNK
jgi:hypothetical protein